MARRADVRFASATEALEVLALLDSDPAEAALQLGITDVARAFATISLPH